MLTITGKKFILLILYTPTDNSFNYPIAGRTRLMKMGFLFGEELKASFIKDRNVSFEMPTYDPWKYGPFSKELMNDLEFLKNQEYIITTKGEGSPIQEELEEYEYWIDEEVDDNTVEFEQEKFTLTRPKGEEKAKEYWGALTKTQQQVLIDFKSKMVKASLRGILEYVYKKYKLKGYIDKSLIRERFV